MSSRRPLSRAERSLFVLSGIGIFLLTGLGYFNFSRNAIPNIVIPPSAELPVPNGFDIYMAAANMIVSATPAVDGINDTKERTSAEQEKLYSLEKKSAWLKANAKGFVLFDRAMKTPTMFPNPRGTGSSPQLGKLRTLARFKIIESNTYKLRKQPAKATESALDCIHMGVDVSQNANLIGTLVGTALQHIGIAALEDESKTINGLNASEARIAARRLESLIARNPSFLSAIKEERWLVMSYTLDALRNSKVSWRSQFIESPTWRERVNLQLRSAHSVIESVHEDFDKAEAFYKTPYSASKDKNVPDIEYNTYVDMRMNPTLSKSQFNEARRDIMLNFLLTRLALRAYRAENGVYPAKLTQLAPKYLKNVPTDGFAAGKPLSYRLENASYELWSVGPDGKNDNGKPAQGKTSKRQKLMFVKPESTGDFVAGKNS